MTFTIAEIAAATGLTALGDTSLVVRGVSEPSSAGDADLALAMSPSYAEALERGSASAAVLWPGADWQALGLRAALEAPRARLALAALTATFQPALDLAPGIHPAAEIADTAELGEDCWVGPFTVIGPRARIGNRARIAGQVSIGADAELGDGGLIHPGARIGAACRIGVRAVIHANAVIGADGFSFVTPELGAVESAKASGKVEDNTRNVSLVRIHSLAAVEIGDDVEIGAATTIDRGTIAPTRIRSGTKIDNQVQVGHNVQIGETCMICAQTGIAGSTKIGDRVVLGGKTGIADHVVIGSDVVCAAGSLVAGHIRDRSVVMGMPATNRADARRQLMAMRRLPTLIQQVQELRKKLGL